MKYVIIIEDREDGLVDITSEPPMQVVTDMDEPAPMSRWVAGWMLYSLTMLEKPVTPQGRSGSKGEATVGGVSLELRPEDAGLTVLTSAVIRLKMPRPFPSS